jgi:hypothetical protein
LILAVLWVWSDKRTLVRAFDHARRLSLTLFGDVAVTTYQGLTGVLKTWSVKLLPITQQRLQQLMERVGDNHWRIELWVALAVDGSRVDTPRTKSNEKAFAAKNFGKGSKARSRVKWKNRKKRSKKLSAPVKPQMWITLIWHMGLKSPWTWKTDASTSSERHHLMDMLKTEKVGKHAGLWRCGFRGLRLLELHCGFRSRRSDTRRSQRASVDRPGTRSSSQWHCVSGQLHSRTSACSYVELDWSLVGLWMIQLFAVNEQIKVARAPDGSSVSLSLAIIQNAMNLSHEAALNGRVLDHQLSEAVKDQYVRTSSKSARYQAHKKDKPSATQPVLLKATTKQQKAFRELKQAT